MFLKAKAKTLLKTGEYQPRIFGTEDIFKTTGEYDPCVAAILKKFDDIIVMDIAGEEDLIFEREDQTARPTSSRRRSLNPIPRIFRLIKPKPWDSMDPAANPIVNELIRLTAPQKIRKICGAFKEIVQKLWMAQRAVEKGQLHIAEMRPFHTILYGIEM